MHWGGIARVVFGGGLAVAICNSSGQAATRFRVAQTSTVTNCMMACNSQAASCQTTCLVPGTLPTGAATTGSNTNKHVLPTQLHDPADQLPGALRTHFAVAIGRCGQTDRADQLKSAIDSAIESIAFSVAVRPTVMDSAAR